MGASLDDLRSLPEEWVNEIEWENDTVLMVRYEVIDVEKVCNDVRDFLNKHGRDVAFNGSVDGCEHLHDVCKFVLTLIEEGEEYTNEDFIEYLKIHIEDEVNAEFHSDAESIYEAKLDGSWWRD